jgi:SAM-dependent methyltransferase
MPMRVFLRTMQEQTQDTFGFKWENFPIVGDERPGLAHGEKRIERNGWTVSEFEEWVDGKRVLDAGCGMGWYTDFLSKRNPSGEVYGVDIAERAVRKGHELDNETLLVGDISRLPFADETFDYVACEEVIHHTPDPEGTLEHLVEKLKPGGTLTMYIYKVKPLLREMADTTIRERTTEMDLEECLEFSRQMTDLGEALHDVDDTIVVPDIPTLDIEGGEYSIHEFVYRYFLKCYFDWETENRDVSTATNFDWYRPEYAYRYTESEVREMVEGAGLDLEWLNEQMSGYSVRGTKMA